jgi:putative iron-regulated protein
MSKVRLLAASALVALAAPVFAGQNTAVLDTYADIAEAKFADSVMTAQELHSAVEALIANPSEGSLMTAKDAWLVSGAPYQQTEVYRFGNAHSRRLGRQSKRLAAG